MISITRATEDDYKSIVNIGKISVAEAHRESTTAENMNEYLAANYTDDAIKKELADQNNIYHIISSNGIAAGFSKIILNAAHPDLAAKNVTKLDRIYLLKEFYGLKLGSELLDFNVAISENDNQSGMWLYTWVGNKRAVNFYLKAGFAIIGSHNFHVAGTHYNLNHHMFLKFK
jgi:ribosomal protein S18 acetylase RimI-like enzyme